MRSVTRPASVKVGYVVYPIHYAWDLTDEAGNKLYGKVNFNPDVIDIWKGATPTRMKECLLHEMVHCVNDQLDLKMRERQINLLSETLFAALRENPEATRWILKGGSK